MLMPGRTFAQEDYRYGFNGMESDDEVAGEGNSLTTQFRQYDSRICKWKSTDPVTHHHFSSYSAFDNNPIYWMNPNGANAWKPEEKIIDGKNQVVLVKETGDDYFTLMEYLGKSTEIDYSYGLYYAMAQAIAKEKELEETLKANDGYYPLGENDLPKFVNAALQDKFDSNTKYLQTSVMKVNSATIANSENYNCFSCAVNTSKDGPFDTFGMTHSTTMSVESELYQNYNLVTDPEDYIVGQTIITVDNNGDGRPDHAATFLGFDNSSMEYVFTKNGRVVPPLIQTKETMLKLYNNNGVPGTILGYYNLK